MKKVKRIPVLRHLEKSVFMLHYATRFDLSKVIFRILNFKKYIGEDSIKLLVREKQNKGGIIIIIIIIMSSHVNFILPKYVNYIQKKRNRDTSF